MTSCHTALPTFNAWIREEDEEEKEPKSSQRSASDESEESEPEPPLVVRRKVSFADAFGLNLVSVKEFDNRAESAKGTEGEEYHLSCIFNVEVSDEELALRLHQNKLELESIELLPGSTTIRGTVRVLNLSYHKVVYARTTLDGWQSCFDQLAEYVPGSSDGETDCFSFQFTLMPPIPPNGMRVEFCLCYESSTGVFWANNGGMNYVFFCQQKWIRALKENNEGKERKNEENNPRGKKSCLKSIKKGSCAESKPVDMSSELSEHEASRSLDNKRKTQHKAESRSRDTKEESCVTLAERRKKRRAIQLAYLQDYFSHRKTEVQRGQPSHREKSKRNLNVGLDMPQNSILVMTDTSSTLQICQPRDQNGNTPLIFPDNQISLLNMDWGRNSSSSCPTHPDTSELISGTKAVVFQEEQTGNVSTEFPNDAWNAFLNDTKELEIKTNALDHKSVARPTSASQPSTTEYEPTAGDKIAPVCNAQEHVVTSVNGSHQSFTAMETRDSISTKLSHGPDSSYICDHLSYSEQTQTSSESHTIQESESIGSDWRPGVSEAPHDRHTFGERPFRGGGDPMLLTNPGETVHAEYITESVNSKPGDGVLLEECTSRTGFLDTAMKVKGDTQKGIKDTLTFTGIRNEPFPDSRKSLERQQTDESGEPRNKEEHISKENENAHQVKGISGNEDSEKDLFLRKKQLQEDEEPSCLKHGNSEIWLLSRSVGCNEGELYQQIECLSREEEEAVCYELVKRVYSDSSKKQSEEVSFENIADRGRKIGLKTEGQGICEKQTNSDDYIDKLQISPEICQRTPNLCITSQSSNPSDHFTWPESVSEAELHLFSVPHDDSESEDTLKYRAAQDFQDTDVGTEFSNLFSRTNPTSVGTVTSWLFVCWAKISALSSIIGAFICIILFVIFITAYLHDLPVCLAIYLLSACWWCRQGMKKRVARTDSVD